jgi:hypothetical protein
MPQWEVFVFYYTLANLNGVPTSNEITESISQNIQIRHIDT